MATLRFVSVVMIASVALVAQTLGQTGYAFFDGGDVEHFADDTGGGDDHILRLSSQRVGYVLAHQLCLFNAVSVADVGVAAVADDGLGFVVAPVGVSVGHERLQRLPMMGGRR